MEILSELIKQVTPVDEALVEAYKTVSDEVLAREEERFRERFLEYGGKIVAINKIRREK